MTGARGDTRYHGYGITTGPGHWITAVTLVLVTLSGTARSATPSTSGSTKIAEQKVNPVVLQCHYSLTTNETFDSLQWRKSSTNLTQVSGSGSPSTPLSPWVLSSYSSSARNLTITTAAASVDTALGGSYTCHLITTLNGILTSKTATTSVTIQYKATVAISGSTTINEGERLSLSCSATAVPTATVRWTKPASSETALAINDIQREKAGTYTCSATNTLTPDPGSSVTRIVPKSVSVIVRYLDQNNLTLSRAQVKEHETVNLTCAVASVPAATLEIENPLGTILKSGDGNRITHSKSVNCLDEGVYTCTATNTGVGTETSVATLKVLCTPRPAPKSGSETTPVYRNVSQSASFSASFIAYPAPRFTWYRTDLETGQTTPIQNDPEHYLITTGNTGKSSMLTLIVQSAEDYANYSLKAENSEGETTLDYALRSHTVPFRVLTLSLANATSDRITVQWASSFNGGAEQTYVVQYVPVSTGDDWIEKTVRIRDPGRKKLVYAVISDVHPGRDYHVRVYSNNIFGLSDFSETIAVRTSDVLSFGVGIVVGIIIAVVLMAAVIAGVIIYIRRVKPMREAKKKSTSEVDNPVFNPRMSGSSNYTALEGEREKTTTYDSLHPEHSPESPVYQNVETGTNGGLSAASPATDTAGEVYMNYTPNTEEKHPDKHEKKKKKNVNTKPPKSKKTTTGRPTTTAYENTVLGKDNNVSGEIYANS